MSSVVVRFSTTKCGGNAGRGMMKGYRKRGNKQRHGGWIVYFPRCQSFNIPNSRIPIVIHPPSGFSNEAPTVHTMNGIKTLVYVNIGISNS